MPVKDPEILYDFKAWRIGRNDIPDFFASNKEFPKKKYGRIEIHPAAEPNNILVVHYCLEYFDNYNGEIELSFVHPITQKQTNQKLVVESVRQWGSSKMIYQIKCPAEDCQYQTASIWIGTKPIFYCQNHARVRRYSKTIEQYIAVYRKNPQLIIKILSNDYSTERQKKYAYIALEKLTKKFKRMTKTYENLSEAEKKYYSKLVPVIFSNRSYTPSKRLDSEPIPFQRIY